MTSNFAAIDLGTNTLLILTGKLENGKIIPLEEFCFPVRIGEGVDKTGILNDAAIKRTLETVEKCLNTAHNTGNSGIGAWVATSAVRDARNRDEFLNLCRERFGHTPLIFSGDDEAVTTFTGAISDRKSDKTFINIDIGGGSSEVSWGTKDKCQKTFSLNLGCVRFSERFHLFENATTENIEAAKQAAKEIFTSELGDMPAVAEIIATGGTATTYSAMMQQIDRWDNDAVHGYTGNLSDLASECSKVFKMSIEERKSLHGVMEQRAAVLPAGLLILESFLELTGINTFSVSTRGLRYGLLCRLNHGDLAPTWTW